MLGGEIEKPFWPTVAPHGHVQHALSQRPRPCH